MKRHGRLASLSLLTGPRGDLFCCPSEETNGFFANVWLNLNPNSNGLIPVLIRDICLSELTLLCSRSEEYLL